MEKLIELFDSHLEVFRKFIDRLIVVLFTIQILVVFSQVVSRYVFNSSLTWAEEMARYLQVWVVLLAAAAAVRSGSHISVDYATYNLPMKYKRLLQIIIMFLTTFFLYFVTTYGFKLFLYIHNSRQLSPAMQIPMSIAYSAIPLGALFMLIESTILFLKLIMNKQAEK